MKFIELTQGKIAMVDDEDFPWLNRFSWYAKRDKNTWYAVSESRLGSKRRQLHMHRLLVFGSPEVDHKNLNGLDNTKENLRHASRNENLRNQLKCTRKCASRFKGLYWSHYRSRWIVRICYGANKRRIYIGSFTDEKAAARAYDAAALEYFKEFARPNFQQPSSA